MAAIAESTALNFVMLATAKTLLFNFIRVLSITLKNELKRLEFGTLMRSITEGLILRFTACAIIIGLSLLKINFVGFPLSYNRFTAIFGELATISNKAWRLLLLIFIGLFISLFKDFLLLLLDLFLLFGFILNNRNYLLLYGLFNNLCFLWDDSRLLLLGLFFYYRFLDLFVFLSRLLLDSFLLCSFFLLLLLSLIDLLFLLPELIESALHSVSGSLVWSNS